MIRDYFIQNLKNIILWGIICLIFFAVFSLYELPVSAVAYAAVLSGFFGIIFMTADFISYRKKIILLKKLADEVIISGDALPEDVGTGREYINLINILRRQNLKIENEMSRKYSEMIDYYTLWAHQIKTPIAAMSLILQNSKNENTAELTENIQKIESYTEMALMFLRLDSDHTDYVIKEYNADDIIRQAVRKFSSQFIRKKLSLTYESVNKTVLTDEKWLLFVIEQVISNAVKYTSSGGIKIYSEEPFTLCIEDSGIGISPFDLPRIFEKGYTGYNGRLDKKASGIGLFLCKRICKNLGHDIYAESGDDGTVIKIDLSRRTLEIE